MTAPHKPHCGTKAKIRLRPDPSRSPPPPGGIHSRGRHWEATKAALTPVSAPPKA